MFYTIDKKNKIFKHIISARKDYNLNPLKAPSYKLIKSNTSTVIETKKPLHEQVILEAAKILMPNIVVTNEQMEILYKKGDLKYLSMPDGYVSYNLYKMLDPKLAIDLRTLTNQSKTENKIISTTYIPIESIEDESLSYLKVYIVPLLEKEIQCLYITFQR